MKWNFYLISGGGEYDVQLGFGWSNGIILNFLDKYGHRLKDGLGQERHAAEKFYKILNEDEIGLQRYW